MRKILFLTGTRADYGKMKPLMLAVETNPDLECHIFITGMHTLKEFGNTQNEIFKDKFSHTHVYMNQIIEEPMDLVLANTVNGFSRYIRELEPDLIIVHGDRVEALAGALCGAINNVLVAHIEGGEISGTIDESIRHAISKFAHIHFVSNQEARTRLLQLGEDCDSIYVIGSPDIDVILEKSDTKLEEIKKRYDFQYEDYGVLIYHPVTTEIDSIKVNAKELVDAIIESGENYIVVNPNNDAGHTLILEEFKRLDGYDRVRRYPSIRFEFFIEILRNAKFLIGNSSAGIHEAPVIGLPSINVGSRQENRYSYKSIINTANKKEDIIEAIQAVKKLGKMEPSQHFGDGKSRENFIKLISADKIWQTSRQKIFTNIDFLGDDNV